MNSHLTLKQYRNLDLFLFAVMLLLFEWIIATAASRWFPGQPYTVSLVSAITTIVLMRWGPWAAIHAALGGLVYCVVSSAEPRHYLIYIVGNLFAMLSLILLKGFGHKKIRDNVLLSLLFGEATLLFMQLGRAIVALALGSKLLECLAFFTTDALSGLFTVVLVWITRRLDGIFENQISYLLRVQKEQKEEEGGN